MCQPRRRWHGAGAPGHHRNPHTPDLPMWQASVGHACIQVSGAPRRPLCHPFQVTSQTVAGTSTITHHDADRMCGSNSPANERPWKARSTQCARACWPKLQPERCDGAAAPRRSAIRQGQTWPSSVAKPVPRAPMANRYRSYACNHYDWDKTCSRLALSRIASHVATTRPLTEQRAHSVDSWGAAGIHRCGEQSPIPHWL